MQIYLCFLWADKLCTKSEVMFFTRLRSVKFKEIVWSDGRMTFQDIVDHSESVDRPSGR